VYLPASAEVVEGVRYGFAWQATNFPPPQTQAIFSPHSEGHQHAWVTIWQSLRA